MIGIEVKILSLYFQFQLLIIWYLLILRRHEYVGRPIFSHIDTTLSRLYVATDQNALACINLKKGNIGN